MAQCPTSHTLSQACRGSHHRDGETAPRLGRLRPLLPSSFRKGPRRVAQLWLLPSPNQASPVQMGFLPPFRHKRPPAWAQVPVLQSDLVYVTHVHQWLPLSLLLGAHPTPGSVPADHTLSPGCLLSFPEGSESPGGRTPGVKGASGNYQCPSLSCSLSSCLSSLSLGNVNIQQPCLAGKRWKKM